MYLFFFKSWAIGNILLFLHRLPKQTERHSTHYWQGCGETVALSSTTGLLCNPRAQQRVWNITRDHRIFAEFVNLVNEVNEALKLQSFDLTIPFLGACLKEITGQEIFFFMYHNTLGYHHVWRLQIIALFGNRNTFLVWQWSMAPEIIKWYWA